MQYEIFHGWMDRAHGALDATCATSKIRIEAFHCNFVGWKLKRSVGQSSSLHDLAPDNMKF